MEKTAMGIPVSPVRSMDEYWSMLARGLETQCAIYLRNKYEFGTSRMCSEAGIQKTLAYHAEKIAQAEGFHKIKARCICLAVGLCFPDFGSYGMAACENYVIRNHVPWDITEIKIGAIEYRLYAGGDLVAPQLDEVLHAYYENRTDIPEVNVARYCQNAIRKSRKLMQSGMFAGKAIAQVMEDAEKCFSVEKSLMKRDDADIDIPMEVQKKTDEELDSFISFSGLPKGLLEYII